MTRRMAIILMCAMIAGCVGPTARDLSRQASSPAISAATSSASLSVGGKTINAIQAGQPAILTIQLLDPKTNQPVSQVQPEHGKDMHLFVIRQDLSTFAHLHPAQTTTGTFQVGLNQASTDNDNADALHAVPMPGTYFLIAETTVDGTARNDRLTLSVPGLAATTPLTADPKDHDGGVTKYVTAAGGIGTWGDTYQIALNQPAMPGMTHLDIHIRQFGQSTGAYTDVTDIKPWLGMGGHAILIGANGQTVDEKVYRHLHAYSPDQPMDHSSMPEASPDDRFGPNLVFMAMGDDVPPSGLYKLWVQFAHGDRLITVPFTINL